MDESGSRKPVRRTEARPRAKGQASRVKVAERPLPAVQALNLRETLIGKSVPRIDGRIKVTGEARYITDIALPGMLVGKILFSDRPHARIVRIDTTRARALEGVEAVITAADAPTRRYGLYVFDRTIFARDRVRHIGEPVAAVAAVSRKVAEAAIRLISVDYEDMPAVFTTDAALAPGAPQIHPEVGDYGAIYPYVKYGNACMDARVVRGDPEAGFARADRVFEHTFRTHPMHQASIEPHACVADYDHSGRLTVWTGTQQMSVCHAELCASLDVPLTKVRVIPAWLGGGFGGKLKTLHEGIVALLTMATRRPVKIELTREEEFTASHPRAGFEIRVKTGVRADGLLLAKDVDIVCDVGAYSDHAHGMVTHAMGYTTGPYEVPDAVSRGRAVYTNNPDWGCMRGYGGLEIAWATESQMDLMARDLGIDPVAIRRMNLVQEGTPYFTTQELTSVQIAETMAEAIRISGYEEKKGRLPANRGIGLANTMLGSGFLASSAFVRLNQDGTVNVLTGVTDLGTGNQTALCQIAAEALGVPFESVSIAAQDSDVSPYDTGSIASRTIHSAGNAIHRAAVDARAQIAEIAAAGFGCDASDVVVENGRVYDRRHPDVARPIAAIAFEAHFVRAQGPILGRGAVLMNPPHESPIGVGFSERPTGAFTFGTHVVEVEVDPETGRVTVLNYTACHDVGRVINRAGIEGQVEGGVVQGIGYGLYEELIVKDGRIQNPSFVDYRLPTALDIDFRINTAFVEVPAANGPFGAKGVSEPPMIPPPAALANAILDATGVSVRETPITAERLYWAIADQT